MWSWKALGVVVLTAGALSIPLYSYWEFLTRGMRPPEATQILNELEKSGIPNFTLPDLNGHPVSFEAFKGKLVLVNIWATWCAPCVKEFPSLKGLVEKFNGELVVLAISHDRNKEDIESFVRAFGKIPENFILLWDQEKAVDKIFGTEALPETYIVSPQGKLLRKVAGDTTWDDAMAVEFFKDILEKHAPAKSNESAGGGTKLNSTPDAGAGGKRIKGRIETH